MVTYEFISEPAPDQVRQIIGLYEMEGWWSSKDGDNYGLVERIIKGSHCFLAAIEDKQIVGVGRVISDGASDAYIHAVTVHSDYRGRGIGTEIIKTLISLLYSDGLVWIGLIAEKDSHEFYRRLGFNQMPNATPMLLTRES